MHNISCNMLGDLAKERRKVSIYAFHRISGAGSPIINNPLSSKNGPSLIIPLKQFRWQAERLKFIRNSFFRSHLCLQVGEHSNTGQHKLLMLLIDFRTLRGAGGVGRHLNEGAPDKTPII